MKKFCAVAVAVALASMASANAQEEEYYVVQDKMTRKCSVAHKKPTSDSNLIIVSDGIYRTRAEAEAGIEKISACSKS